MPITKSKGKELAEGSSSSRLSRKLKPNGASEPPSPSTKSKGKGRAVELGSSPGPSNLRRIHRSQGASTTLPPHSPVSESSLRDITSPEMNIVLEGIVTDTETSNNAAKQTESTFLAQKIRGLINSFPTLSSRFLPSSSKDPSALESDGRPIPPPGAVRLQDPDLISLLSSPDIMNGSDGRRQSVWSMLEEIRPPSARSVVESIDESFEYTGSDRSSVMMYSPLIPNADSVIELAELEEVPVNPVPSAEAARWWWPDWSNFWWSSGWSNSATETQTASVPTPTHGIITPQIIERRVAVPVQRVWVPSTTQLSFETTWWGYRIYLPPPVLAILDDQSVEAAQQATVITAALTWFFSNLPISTFPPPIQPAIILLQRLVPLGSYLGTFISWSWATIRGFDQGHGVILTATWLLPIALIPGTWRARDFPTPSSPSAGAPLEVELTADTESEQSIPLPPAPAPAIKPLPPCSDDPPILVPPSPPPPMSERQSSSSSSRKSKFKTLRKLTRTFT
ncbi:hypothetical protein R3P38DRAFT_2909180 [Favolaschia claudopus]|uniref:Uncharacterized protein n=1 Tax=Favolaschia claudopus TaxID=2862362 RepID=A0AAW0C8V4_9AGAR